MLSTITVGVCRVRFGLVSAFAMLLTAFFLFAPPKIAGAQSLDRPQVEQIIREYLLENPELMLEVQEALEQKHEAIRVAQQQETLTEMRDLIYSSPNQMIIGNPDAKLTVVEFFDYNCGFCKRALDDMDRIIEANPDVKFVMKEFPVLGQASLRAHQVSLGMIRLYPDLYPEFHRQLLGADGQKDGELALKIAEELGADRQKLEAEAGKPSINDAVREVYQIADGLGITGTPSYVVGDKVVFGAVGYESLMADIENVRSCGKAVC